MDLGLLGLNRTNFELCVTKRKFTKNLYFFSYHLSVICSFFVLFLTFVLIFGSIVFFEEKVFLMQFYMFRSLLS